MAGFCEFVPGADGRLMAVPKSTSFSNMDQAEFDRHYQNAVTQVLKLLPESCSEETIIEALSYA